MDLLMDNNNNASGEKSYSLRPRTSPKKDDEDFDDEHSAKPRGRTRRRQRQKSAPLSKYRRKTANARERSRMREINYAFETLRRAIPRLALSCDSNEKISKIMTLRLAMKYITALSNALEEPEAYSSNFQNTLSLIDKSSENSSAPVLPSWNYQHLPTTPPLEPSLTISKELRTETNLKSSEIYSEGSNFQQSFTSLFVQGPCDNLSNTFNRCPQLAIPTIERSSQPPIVFVDSESQHHIRYTLTPPDDAIHLQVNTSSSTIQKHSLFSSSELVVSSSPTIDFGDFFIS